jgi:hypothetical protein
MEQDSNNFASLLNPVMSKLFAFPNTKGTISCGRTFVYTLLPREPFTGTVTLKNHDLASRSL